jgi:uncharacterized protein (TIGR02284 family)
MANEIVSTLNSLIETVKDGEEGFKTAASNVKDTGVRATFEEFARQRHDFAAELQGEVRKLGGDPTESSSVASAAHRGWINLKGALGGGEKAILNEAERGEDLAVNDYQKAMNSDLPPGVAQVIGRQFGQVKSAHDRVKGLRDSWK